MAKNTGQRDTIKEEYKGAPSVLKIKLVFDVFNCIIFSINDISNYCLPNLLSSFLNGLAYSIS